MKLLNGPHLKLFKVNDCLRACYGGRGNRFFVEKSFEGQSMKTMSFLSSTLHLCQLDGK